MKFKIGTLVHFPSSSYDNESIGLIYKCVEPHYFVFWFDGIYSEEDEEHIAKYVEGLSEDQS